MNNYYEAVKNYFNNKASAYDDVDNQLYWVLSDLFFKEILRRELTAFVSEHKEIMLLDAGAGTGRWTIFFHEIFGNDAEISGKLVDISPKMLKQAEAKMAELGLAEKFSCSVENIEKLDAIENNSFDISLSFYNVLSFVENPAAAISEIAKKLRQGGIHVSVVANKYHAYYFSILTNRLDQLEKISRESKIRFNDEMPFIYCFGPEEIKSIYLQNGFSEVSVLGGPNFIYPGMEETKIYGNTEQIVNKLSDQDNFKRILEAELANYKNADIVGRGNVLLIIAKK